MTKLTEIKEQQEEAPPKLIEHHPLKSLVYPFEVIVSPFRAFKEIVQNPDFKGIVLIVGLVLLATAGMYYTYASKVFFLINGTTTETSLLASNVFNNYVIIALTQTALFFFFNWIIYAGVLLLVMRVFGEKGGSWRPFFILVGYAFSIMIIQSVASALLIASLPEVHLTITSWPPSGQDEATVNNSFTEAWGPTLAGQALTYLTFPSINLIEIWLVMISVVAVRAFSGTNWGKAASISITAFIIRFFLRLFLGF